jgi:hypothetical protein
MMNRDLNNDKKLAFIHRMAKMGLQHFDSGGTALGGPTQAGPAPNTTSGSIAGTVGNILGTNNSFQGTGAPIQAGTNAAQLNNAYTGAQGAINTQAGITGTLNQGLGQGAATQANLTSMLTNQARGLGPNPAQAELNQATGQNIAEQAALAAGQRGTGANAGLIARQNAQQGAATQQQAVGQGATMQAQQELAAEGNLQNLAANQVAQGTTATQGLNSVQQNEQNILQGANTGYNNANVGMQSNLNNVNAAISTANQNNGSNVISGIGGALSSLPVIGSIFEKGGIVKMDKGGRVLNAKARAHISASNFALPGRRYPIHDANHARNALARVSQHGTPAEKAKVRAAVHKKYPGIGVAHMAQGGITGEATSGPQSYVGQWLNSNTSSSPPPMIPQANIDTKMSSPFQFLQGSKGGAQQTDSFANVNPVVGTGAVSSAPVGLIAGGQGEGGFAENMAYSGGLMKRGGKVKAANASEKAVKKGDSLENDKVPAMLSEGEGVIDRETMQDPGHIGQMARVVMAHINRKKSGK